MSQAKSVPLNSIFKFKEFEIDQTGCAMRINTDGVLLGAMADHSHPRRILDIGTGTGVIAMMLAQRFTDARVEAIEIDMDAAATGDKNFKNSKYASRLLIHHTSIEQFNDSEKFDLIVSNPPFFVNDLPSAAQKKGLARHTDQNFFYNLVLKIDELLTFEGLFWYILPLKQADLLENFASEKGLFPNKSVYIFSDKSKTAFRKIGVLGKIKVKMTTHNFYIYESQKVHTQMYKDVLKEFFLKY